MDPRKRVPSGCHQWDGSVITEFRLAAVLELMCALTSTGTGSLMFTKCANPRCSARLRHLHEGKLFMFEFKKVCSGGSEYSPSAELMGKVHGLHGLHYAWLCDTCARGLDVKPDNGGFQIVARAA